MTLDELKKRATASELTLIEATEAAVREIAASTARGILMRFLRNNPAPSREDRDLRGVSPEDWLARLDEHLKNELS